MPSIAVGLVLVVVAGGLNGSWNAAFSPTHGLAVRRVRPDHNDTTSDEQPIDLSYHHAWVLFQVYAALINIPVCLYWAGGPERVGFLVRQASGTDLALIVLFSALWGIGSVGFGLACKIAGVGLGTNLCMGVIMVLGTLLPLCTEQAIATPGGGVVLAGLALCCLGLAFSVGSLQQRDADERSAAAGGKPTKNQEPTPSKTLLGETIGTTIGTAPENPGSDSEDGGPTSTEISRKSIMLEEGGEGRPAKDDLRRQRQQRQQETPEYSTFYKVAVCVVAGVFAAQLQFAFVFGSDLTDLAGSPEGPGSTPPSGTSAVIWLFAISLGAPPSIVYGLYSNPPDIPLDRMWRCPWWRHLLLIGSTSLPWVAHIHLYGYSTTLLPEDLAASVAWPVLMMTTVVAGILWSVVLGEWNRASIAARRKLGWGLGTVTLGVAVIMASVAV